MARSYERTIRWKAIGIYMFIAVICLAVSAYIYNLSRNVSGQKRHIENYYELLRVTNRVSFAVSDAQSAANLYLTSKNGSHLVAFNRKVGETELLIDSLTMLSRLTGDTSNVGSLGQIGGLLRRKGEIIYQLNTQLVSYNPVDSIAQRLFLYEDPEQAAAVNDSVFLLGERKGLLDVMSNVFVPERYRDSLLMAYRSRPEAVEIERDDSIKIAAEVRQYVEQVRTGYSSNLREVERQINRLMRTDQEISGQIIEVLNRFHRTTMQSTIRHIEDSEQAIRRNYKYSMGGIVISLLLITLLVILIISDANKGQRSRLALERANARIREIMASRHKLLLSVSHDIKTPLNAILGYLELWKQGHEVDSSGLGAAELSGKHIGALINNLLEFSSLQQGISRPSPQAVDLPLFCQETAGMIRTQATKKGLTFTTQFVLPGGLTVETDPMRLRQIVLNILSNAVKYTDDGSITFRAGYENGQIRFHITDTGAGMEQDKLEDIFRPFSRIEANRNMAEGHGYGMYVVKGLLDLLDGQIGIDSTPGRGTEVSITVPAPMVSGQDSTSVPAPDKAARILFVDDDPVLLQVLGSLASGLGHSVRTTTDAAGVVSGAADLSEIDIVVTDMEMGSVKGTAVLEAIRKSHPALPVALMTGHHEITAGRARAMGFDGYIEKPVSRESILSVVAGCLEGETTSADTGFTPQSLGEMFSDEQTLREIMDTFIAATRDDLKALRSALFHRNHSRVRELCHRLHPLFVQFGAGECVDVLARINGQSPDSRGKTAYWQDVSLFIAKGTEFIEALETK